MRNRQHVNVHSICFMEFTGQMPRIDEGKKVELEIGCADAQFLFERAQRDPSRIYIGLEIREPLVDAVNKKAKALNLPVQAIFVHAGLHLSKLLPEQSVAQCFLNFPDPCFKRRHRDRRMINEELLQQLHPIMEKDGEILMQSDVFDVALDAMDVFERCDDLYKNMVAPWSFWKGENPYQVRSWREMNCEENEMPIWRMRYLPR